MSTRLNLRLAEQHKAVRAKSIERRQQRMAQDIYFEPARGYYVYVDGSPVDREDARLAEIRRRYLPQEWTVGR